MEKIRKHLGMLQFRLRSLWIDDDIKPAFKDYSRQWVIYHNPITINWLKFDCHDPWNKLYLQILMERMRDNPFDGHELKDGIIRTTFLEYTGAIEILYNYIYVSN